MSLPFHDSPRATVGIEWELQLVDRETRDLRQDADTLLRLACPDGAESPYVKHEMLANTVEVTADPSADVPASVRDIGATVASLQALASPLGIDVASAGSHPFADPFRQRVTAKERYAELLRRTRYWGRQLLLWGVHVHVGVESRDKVLPLMGGLLAHYGELLALSASSPYWAGVDTGYASTRSTYFHQIPTAGLPPDLADWAELESYSEAMHATGTIRSFDELRWDVRPSPKFGTVETRIFDSATNLAELAAFAALDHCLVEYFSRQIDAGERPASLPRWIVKENKWRAARYGMDARVVVDRAGREVAVRDRVPALLESLAPVAADLGCSRALEGVGEILRLGASYERQRFVATHSSGDLPTVVDYVCAETRAGRPLDPREYLDSHGPGSR